MPIFADQELNIQHAERMGVAIKLAYKDISKETVLDIAKRLLEDPKYSFYMVFKRSKSHRV